MLLRRARIEDAQLLLSWRNDPETRLQSKSTEEISVEDHIQWLTKILKNSQIKLYIAEVNQIPVGTVRSNRDRDGTLELSWTVAPIHRGKGLGKIMVMQFVQKLHPRQKFIARIRKGNISSENIAKALGLQEDMSVVLKDNGDKHPFTLWR